MRSSIDSIENETPKSKRSAHSIAAGRPRHGGPLNIPLSGLGMQEQTPNGIMQNKQAGSLPGLKPVKRAQIAEPLKLGLGSQKMQRPMGLPQQSNYYGIDSVNNFPQEDVDPLAGYLAYEANQRKQSKKLRRQDEVLKQMMDNQERLVQQINSQKRFQVEMEARYRRELSRARHLDQFNTRSINSREREYANLDMLNKLGESMKNGDYSLGFLFDNHQSGPRLEGNYEKYLDGRPKDADDFLPNGMNLIQRDMRSILGNQRGAPYNQYEVMAHQRSMSQVPRPEKPKKKKKKSNFMDSILPFILLTQMGNGGKSDQESKLLSALDSQNKVLASLANDVAANQYKEYDSEKSELEHKIAQLESKMYPRPRKM